MCGFFFYYKISKNYNKNKFLKSSELLSHRGPDDHSSYFDEDVAISFYRLSIRDLSPKGRQPMMSKSKRYIMVFNGEIYNSEYLKKIFNLTNLSGNSDSEILLQFIEKYGLTKINYLKGMFSIIIYDKKLKKITAVRDRFGIKPLYYYKSKDFLIFSSEIKPILNFINSNEINDESLLSFLLKGQIENNKDTLFSKINCLNASNFLIADKKKFVTKQYWKLNTKLQKTSLSKAKSLLLQKLNNSIGEHSVSDKKIGIFLSGGTDSSTIAKIFKNNSKENFSTFTYDFLNNKNFSELSKAKTISKNLNVKNFSCLVKPKYITDNFQKIVNIIESPITSLRLFGVFKLYKLAKKKNFDVIFEGHGGDEMLGGYNYNSLFNIFSDMRNKKKITKNMIDFFIHSNFDENKILNNIITLTNQAGSTTDGTPYVYVDLFNKDFLNEHIHKVFLNKISKIKNPLLRSQMDDINNLKIPRVLKYTDRLSMKNSIEARVPFLDHDLFQFCFSLPNDLKFNNKNSRWVFKEATKKIYKNLKFTKNKKHIVDPQTLWLKTDLKDFFLDILKSTSFKNLDYFNSKKIVLHYEDFLKGKVPTSFNLFQILSTYFFLKGFKNE